MIKSHTCSSYIFNTLIFMTRNKVRKCFSCTMRTIMSCYSGVFSVLFKCSCYRIYCYRSYFSFVSIRNPSLPFSSRLLSSITVRVNLANIFVRYSFSLFPWCSWSHNRINAETVISLSSAICFKALRSSFDIVMVRFTIFLSAISFYLSNTFSCVSV